MPGHGRWKGLGVPDKGTFVLRWPLAPSLAESRQSGRHRAEVKFS